MIRWFARGGGIRQCGPFRSQVEATNAMRLVEEDDDEYARLRSMHGSSFRPQYRGGFPPDVFVWPEEVP